MGPGTPGGVGRVAGLREHLACGESRCLPFRNTQAPSRDTLQGSLGDGPGDKGRVPPPHTLSSRKRVLRRGLGEACPGTRAQQEGVQTQGQWAQGEGKLQGVAVPQEGCCGGQVWSWGRVNSSLLEGPQGEPWVGTEVSDRGCSAPPSSSPEIQGLPNLCASPGAARPRPAASVGLSLYRGLICTCRCPFHLQEETQTTQVPETEAAFLPSEHPLTAGLSSRLYRSENHTRHQHYFT